MLASTFCSLCVLVSTSCTVALASAGSSRQSDLPQRQKTLEPRIDAATGIHLDAFLTDTPPVQKRDSGRTGAVTVLFTDNSTSSNVTIGKCGLRWYTVIGRWTLSDQTVRNNATYIDIYRDVCQSVGLAGNNGTQLDNPKFQRALNKSISINVNALKDETSAFLNEIVPTLNFTDCDSNTPLSAVDDRTELRRLLQLDQEDLQVVSLLATVFQPQVIVKALAKTLGVIGYNQTDVQLGVGLLMQLYSPYWVVSFTLMTYRFAQMIAADLQRHLNEGINEMMAAAALGIFRRDALLLAMMAGVVRAITDEDPKLLAQKLQAVDAPQLETAVSARLAESHSCGVQGGLDPTLAKFHQSNSSALGIRPTSDVEDAIQSQIQDGQCPNLN